jgi:hypothetical protein
MTDQLIVERGNADEVLDLAKAQEVLEKLCEHYPLHPWGVSFQGRVLVVRHEAISAAVRWKLSRDGFGFVIKHADSHSASDLAHKAVMAGGEMLEAFGFKRGSWDGSEPTIPKTFKPRRPETFN